MKKKKIFVMLVIAISLFTLATGFAETRNIYIGDIIQLKIASSDFSKTEIEAVFKDFEIVAYKEVSDGVELKVQCFDVGEKRLKLGEQEIVITIASTLKDISRDDIFESKQGVVEAGLLTSPYIVLYIFAGLFVLSSGLYFLRKMPKKIPAPLTALKQFEKDMSCLKVEDQNYLVEMTLILKSYLGVKFLKRNNELDKDGEQSVDNERDGELMGLTTSETLKVLSRVGFLSVHIKAIQTWLDKCDYIKFSGQVITAEEKENQRLQLRLLVETLESIERDVKDERGSL